MELPETFFQKCQLYYTDYIKCILLQYTKKELNLFKFSSFFYTSIYKKENGR